MKNSSVSQLKILTFGRVRSENNYIIQAGCYSFRWCSVKMTKKPYCLPSTLAQNMRSINTSNSLLLCLQSAAMRNCNSLVYSNLGTGLNFLHCAATLQMRDKYRSQDHYNDNFLCTRHFSHFLSAIHISADNYAGSQVMHIPSLSARFNVCQHGYDYNATVDVSYPVDTDWREWRWQMIYDACILVTHFPKK
jgi:hypothetical protein